MLSFFVAAVFYRCGFMRFYPPVWCGKIRDQFLNDRLCGLAMACTGARDAQNFLFKVRSVVLWLKLTC